MMLIKFMNVIFPVYKKNLIMLIMLEPMMKQEKWVLGGILVNEMFYAIPI